MAWRRVRRGPDAAMEEDATLVQDHHDYAKRRCETQDRQGGHTPPPPPLDPPPAKKGRQQRDPDGGTYISARSRMRKAPLPMKLRALPASFWEQPNLNKGPSPGIIFAALPPLCRDECDEMHHARGLCRGGSECAPASLYQDRLVSQSPADTDLLFSLFHSVEAKTTARRRTRGRPRRNVPASGLGTGLTRTAPGHRDDDPCLLDSLTGGLVSRQMGGLSAMDDGRGTMSVLRGCPVDNNNLAQILSDLVVKL